MRNGGHFLPPSAMFIYLKTTAASKESARNGPSGYQQRKSLRKLLRSEVVICTTFTWLYMATAVVNGSRGKMKRVVLAARPVQLFRVLFRRCWRWLRVHSFRLRPGTRLRSSIVQSAVCSKELVDCSRSRHNVRKRFMAVIFKPEHVNTFLNKIYL